MRVSLIHARPIDQHSWLAGSMGNEAGQGEAWSQALEGATTLNKLYRRLTASGKSGGKGDTNTRTA